MSNETFPMFVLKRDGNEVKRGSEIALWDYIHDNHCYSVDHAIRYEGYTITPA